MKKQILLSGLCLMFAVGNAQEGFKEGLEKVAEDVQSGLQNSKEKILEVTKDTQEEIDKLRDDIKEKIDEMHPNYSVSDEASLKEYIDVVIKGTELKDDHLFVVKATLTNKTDKPVDFDNTMSKTDLVVVDAKGIPHFSTDEDFAKHKAIVVPAGESLDVEWIFKDAKSQPETVSIFGVVYSLK